MFQNSNYFAEKTFDYVRFRPTYPVRLVEKSWSTILTLDSL